MTDDKEERIHLELTVDEFQELIEGYTGDSEGVYEKLKNAVPSLAPTHTDEEYDILFHSYKEALTHILFHSYKEALTRIKELEAELKEQHYEEYGRGSGGP